MIPVKESVNKSIMEVLCTEGSCQVRAETDMSFEISLCREFNRYEKHIPVFFPSVVYNLSLFVHITYTAK